MKSGLVASSVLHVALLAWAFWSLSAPKPLDVSYSEALPVEIVMADAFEGVKGEKDKPVKDKPAPTPSKKPQALPMPAENPGENEADLKTPPVPDVKPNKVEPTPTASKAEPPPPETKPPTPEPKPPTPVKPTPLKPAIEPAKPEPAQKPEPTPLPIPLPTPVKEPPKQEQAPDLVEQAIAEAEAAPQPAPKVEAKPEKVPKPADKPAPQPPEKVDPPAKPVETATPQDKPVTKPAKADPTKRDKPKDAKTADRKSDAPETTEFNAEDIAALLSKQKASGGGAKHSTAEASLGSKKTTGTRLSRSEIGELQGMVQDQMAKCWSPPTGLEDAGALRVSIQIRFDPTGALDGTPTIVDQGTSSGAQRIANEAAMRAIRRCAPFNLPADKYAGGWDETILNFDPSQMN